MNLPDPAVRHRPLSVEEYLELEEASSVKHEYVAGEIHAFAGATKRHNRIILNIVSRLWNASRESGCRVYTSDVKLRAAPDIIYYPDVMVACGPEGDDPLIEDAPCLVVEVTSPSTERTDRREKLIVYKQIPSLRAYLIVDKERRRVQRHWRDEEGVLWDADVSDAGRVPLPCPELELTLEEIYDGVSSAEAR
jgi:Uma2 family endonuclease